MDVIDKQTVKPSIRASKKGSMTVFDFLSKCDGKEVFHFNDNEDMKLNIDDAYHYAQDLRSMLMAEHGEDAPTVTHSTNRVILALPYEKV